MMIAKSEILNKGSPRKFLPLVHRDDNSINHERSGHPYLQHKIPVLQRKKETNHTQIYIARNSVSYSIASSPKE